MLTICMSKDYNNINKPGPNETLEKPRTTKTTKNDATMTIWIQGDKIETIRTKCIATKICDTIEWWMILSTLEHTSCYTNLQNVILGICFYFISILLYTCIKTLVSYLTNCNYIPNIQINM